MHREAENGRIADDVLSVARGTTDFFLHPVVTCAIHSTDPCRVTLITLLSTPSARETRHYVIEGTHIREIKRDIKDRDLSEVILNSHL